MIFAYFAVSVIFIVVMFLILRKKPTENQIEYIEVENNDKDRKIELLEAENSQLLAELADTKRKLAQNREIPLKEKAQEIKLPENKPQTNIINGEIKSAFYFVEGPSMNNKKISGAIKNISNAIIKSLELHFILYDLYGTEIDDVCYNHYEEIKAGKFWDFEEKIYENEAKSFKLSKIQAEFTFGEKEYKDKENSIIDLTINGVVKFGKEPKPYEKNEKVVLRGTLKNISDKTLTDITINYNLHDSDGNFIEEIRAISDDDLLSGKEWNFETIDFNIENVKTVSLASVEVIFDFETE